MTQGDWIKKARIDAGHTLEEVATVAGTTKQTIHKYETNVVTNIPMDKIKPIASFLGVTPQRLLGWDDTPPAPAPTLPDERTKEIIELVSRLTPQEKDMIIAQLKGILAMRKSHPAPDL